MITEGKCHYIWNKLVLNKLKTYKDRFYFEKWELGIRIDKLLKFINENPAFKTLDNDHQKLLQKQLDKMFELQSILDDRAEKEWN